MLSNKKISPWMVFLLVVVGTACQTYVIPLAYDTPYNEIMENPYGCWSEFDVENLTFSVSGELICLDQDTVYVLANDNHIRTIEASQITSYKIYTHKNLSGRYGKISLFYLIPSVVGAVVQSEFSGEFLSLGLPVAVVGLTHIIIEGSTNKNVITEKQNLRIHGIARYARFPGGKPIGVDLKKLTLKE